MIKNFVKLSELILFSYFLLTTTISSKAMAADNTQINKAAKTRTTYRDFQCQYGSPQLC